MRISHFPLALFSLAICAQAPPRAVSPQGPTAELRTLRTRHYRIHYPLALEAFAKDIAGRVEPIHELLRREIGKVYDGGVDIRIQDPVLDANGSAHPSPNGPRVILYARRPESEGGLGHSQDWVELLLLHELVHIHHMTWPQHKPSLTDRIQETLFERTRPVGRKSPRWVTEGYATLLEGRLTGSGRPHSAYRAGMIRTYALKGMLPAYESLNSMEPPHGGHMAYLVGSAFLEWLEHRPGAAPDVLRGLWRRLAAPRQPTFEAAFRATFGQGPAEAYLRFRAEVTADALALERRAQEGGWLKEGEIFVQAPCALVDLALSPDGAHLAAYAADRAQPGIWIWSLSPSTAPPSTKQTVPDPEDPAPVPSLTRERTTKARIPRQGGFPPRRPRWESPERLTFDLHRPDWEGVLQPESRTVTPIGTRPVSVRQGRFKTLRPEAGSLRLDGRTLPLPGIPVGPATLDTQARVLYAALERDSAWHLVAHDLASGATRTLGRSLGLAWNPVPTPDGKSVWYLCLAPMGTQIRHLEIADAGLQESPLPMPERPFAPGVLASAPDAPSQVPPGLPPGQPEPYRPFAHQSLQIEPLLLESPSTRALQLAVSGTDLLGRIQWDALASFGAEGAGPRGGTVAFESRAWRWAPRIQAFSSQEDVSRQRLDPKPGLDLRRRGAELSATWKNLGPLPLAFHSFLALERIAQPGSETVTRRVLALEGFVQQRLAPPPGLHLALSGGAWVASGRTDGQAWSLTRLEGGLRADLGDDLPLLVTRGEWGRLGGAPTAHDRFRAGGLSHGLLPTGLALNQVDQAALPAFTLTGTRLERLRVELTTRLRAYGDIIRLGDGPMNRTRVIGLEAPLGWTAPRSLGHPTDRFIASLGIHRAFDGVMKGRTVGTFTLLFRP